MTSRPPRRGDSQARREMLANWLALLTLLALGIVWPGEDAGGGAAQRTGGARLEASRAYALR